MLARSQLFAVNADIAAWGITFDLTITIPLAFWWLVIRRGKAHALAVVPVFLGGTVTATLLLPLHAHDFVAQLRSVVLPLAAFAVAGVIAHRLRRARNAVAAAQDVPERIALVARTLGGESRVAAVVASEVTLLYYALFGWRRSPDPVPGQPFTVHERSGWSSVLVCVFVVIGVEAVGMHLLLALWSPLAAWGWTALDLWAVLWLLGDYNGLRLVRSSLDDRSLTIRHGLRWSLTIPLASIVSVDDVREESEWRRRDVLKVAMLEDPRWIVRLREPLVARGLAGLTRTVRAVALLPDDERVISALRLAIDHRRRDTPADLL